MPTIKRLEAMDGALSGHATTIRALQSALEAAGVQFIPENGGGAGVRLAKPTEGRQHGAAPQRTKGSENG